MVAALMKFPTRSTERERNYVMRTGLGLVIHSGQDVASGEIRHEKTTAVIAFTSVVLAVGAGKLAFAQQQSQDVDRQGHGEKRRRSRPVREIPEDGSEKGRTGSARASLLLKGLR
jgi:hypothetical protein